MHFGRAASDKGLDLQLPPVGARTERYLSLQHNGRGLLYLGAPIWNCADWKGTIYPETARPSEYLRYYAQQFAMIELNSSFYRVPSREQVRLWRHDVNADFKFCPKVPKDLSHALARLDQDLLKTFLSSVESFENNLGLCFLQLPETFALADFRHLENFAAQWPKDFPLAIEFRHSTWFKDGMLLDPLINFLYRQSIGTVITDTPLRRDVLHMALTHPNVLVRFMGIFPSKTDDDRLRTWLDRLQHWAKSGMDQIYLAVHQERNGSIPQTLDFARRYLYEKGFQIV